MEPSDRIRIVMDSNGSIVAARYISGTDVGITYVTIEDPPRIQFMPWTSVRLIHLDDATERANEKA